MSAIVVEHVSHRYGKVLALDDVSVSLPAGATVGLIGPDGVGKSTLLGLIAGVRKLQSGSLRVLGGDMAREAERLALAACIAYMPQGLGRNLYPTLSVRENIDFHARLFGLHGEAKRLRIMRLLDATGLAPFADRAAGKLSGGMKQKASLCCALVHQPDLLILDEPTTGVDPLSRRQFWTLVHDLQTESAQMTVLVATAYIEEAEPFAELLAMDAGKLLIHAPTSSLLHAYPDLETAYIALLPPEKQRGAGSLQLTPFTPDPALPPAMEAHHLTKRFGDFVAVDDVSFTIAQGEIFGFLGSNGCGKSTTMKMLTGLLQATSGTAELLGAPVAAGSVESRMRIGYMSQAFSLYEELTVRQNLVLHARLYRLGSRRQAAIAEALVQYELVEVADSKPAALPLGIRQRLQLAAACLHRPDVLILDEPTSGVDPAARDMFWRHLLRMSREEKITIFVSTHFMNEAARCDRISFMYQGRVLAVGTPAELTEKYRAPNLEAAFIAYLQAEQGREDTSPATPLPEALPPAQKRPLRDWCAGILTIAVREGREFLRDRVRTFFALFGPVILMTAVTWGVSFDVGTLAFAVRDRDHSAQSRALLEYFSGSAYFRELAPLSADADIDRVLESSRAKLVIDIPPDFGRNLLQGTRPEIAFYIDGAESFNAGNLQGYIAALLGDYARDQARMHGLPPQEASATLIPRFQYNPEFKSILAIAPGVLMIALTLFPAMMAALGVVREREIGSIANFYASPASRLQFLLGKQLPYLAAAFASFLLLFAMMMFWFGVPLKGSVWALVGGTVLMCAVSTGMGLFISCFTRTQVAAIFITAVATTLPALSFSGFIVPVSSLQGGAYVLGKTLPASWYGNITTGTFIKGLAFPDLLREHMVLGGYYLLFLTLAVLNVKKQER